MPALAVVQDRPRLEVLQGGRGRGRPTGDDRLRTDLEEARLELQVLRSEAQTMHEVIAPYLNRIRIRAKHLTGQEYRDVEVVVHMLERHARQMWTRPETAA